ncbi:unnamed protein product [Prorocentrum cordatum]|uniref:Uncharacterized protein n=1 Tax=Prorocentrum cordatum TaxID=2364126 RepID=A0ABN9Q826_9DINO|nr:unnamed protein product [Polarella glacialis]
MPVMALAVQAMKSATQQFAEEFRAAASGQGTAPVGEPHAHAWTALVMNAVTTTALEDPHLKLLSAHGSAMKTPDHILPRIHVCKVKIEKGHVKVYLATKSSPDCLAPAGAAIAHLLKQGGKEEQVQAPRRLVYSAACI